MAANVETLLAKCLNDNGRSWLKKYIHPPAVADASYVGCPDLSGATKTLKHNVVVTNRMDLPEKWQDNVGGVNMLMLTIPSLKYPVFTATYNVGQNGWAAGPGAMLGSTLGITSPYFNLKDSKQFADARQCYQSTTITYDQNTLVDRGMIYSAQIPFDYDIYTNINASMAVATKFKNGKEWLIGLLDLHHASGKVFTPDNEKMLCALAKTSNREIRAAPPSPYVSDLVYVAVCNLGPVVKTPEDITSLGDRTYIARAKEGAFIVNRMTQPTNRYSAAAMTRNKEGTALSDGTMWICYAQQDETGTNSVYWFTSDGSNQTAKALSDFVWGDFTASLTMFSACARSNDGVQTLDGMPNIVSKCCLGWELRPLQNSSFIPYVTTTALPDIEALKTAAEFNHTAKDAVEAKFNAKGDKNLNASFSAQTEYDPALDKQMREEADGQILDEYLAGKPSHLNPNAKPFVPNFKKPKPPLNINVPSTNDEVIQGKDPIGRPNKRGVRNYRRRAPWSYSNKPRRNPFRSGKLKRRYRPRRRTNKHAHKGAKFPARIVINNNTKVRPQKLSRAPIRKQH